MKRRYGLLSTVALVALVAGCSPGAKVPAAKALTTPAPQGVQIPAVIPSSSAGPAPNCDVRRSSLRPAAGNPTSGATLAAIRAKGRLVVGVDQNTYLFGYRDPQSAQIVGFDIDILRQIAKALFGNPDAIQFTALTSAQRIPAITGKEVDLVAETMTITCDRLQQVDFSTDYYDAGQRVLVPKGSTVKSLADLGGKKVCAAAGSTSIQNIAASSAHPVPVSVADWTDCLVMLQQGQVDAISTDDTILAGLTKQDPNTQLVGQRFTDEPYGIAVNKNQNDLLRFVNGVLEKIRSDGTWVEIYTKWLGGPAPNPPAAGYRD
jgi:polar amino acid transport system substrate-binding protein